MNGGNNNNAKKSTPHSQSERGGNGRITTLSLLRIILAVAIVLFATAPIFLHHSSAGFQPSTVPHQLSHLSTSSRRVGKTATIETARIQLDGKDAFNFAYEDEHRSDVQLPPDVGGAGRSLLLNALEKRPIFDEDFDPEYEKERCRKYFTYAAGNYTFSDYRPRRKRRRVFLGSLIADDSWHALGAVAMETHGIYTAVAFVESNRTQTGVPRQLRFVNGTLEHKILVESDLFGPNTRVLLDDFVLEEQVEGRGLIREHMQRALIIDMWKKEGMTPDDIGVITDADETLTRDFLRAVQSCDFPQLDPEKQNCRAAKVVASSMVFEGSPECMTVTRKWSHPDLVLGKCIEGIGDDKFKLDDKQRHRKFAWRQKEYTAKYGNYSGVSEDATTYPLWNAADFRRDQGGHHIMFEYVDYLPFHMGHTGFHFHNYFETTSQLRAKYSTYGHSIPNAHNLTVSEMHPDLDVMVDCVLERSTTNNKYNTLSTRLEEFEGRIPIAYGLVDGYTMARHFEMKGILTEDVNGHKRTWHDNPRSKDWFENIPK